MKYATISFLALVAMLGILAFTNEGQPSHANNDRETMAFLYQYSYKKFMDLPDRILTDYVLVTKKGDSSYSQFYSQMKIDSIESYRELTDQEYGNFTIRNTPTRVNIINNSISFYGRIGKDYHTYKEKISYKWKLLDSTKYVNSRQCKLAQTKYAGRTWNAWYSTDIPIDVGPYKFKGLPGAIISIYDEKAIFKFDLIQMKKRDDLLVKPYPSIFKISRTEIERQKFNTLQQAYENLSFNEQMAYMNKNKPGDSRLRIVSQDGDETLRTIAVNRPNKYYFIEIDHLDKK